MNELTDCKQQSSIMYMHNGSYIQPDIDMSEDRFDVRPFFCV